MVGYFIPLCACSLRALSIDGRCVVSEWTELLLLFAAIMVAAGLLSFRRHNSHVKPSRRRGSKAADRDSPMR